MFDSTGWFLDEKDGCIDPWPLTTPIGSLDCFESGPNEVQGFVILWTTDPESLDARKMYAVNDVAIAETPFNDFLDINSIRKEAPAGSAEPKVDMSAFVEAGLSVCANF